MLALAALKVGQPVVSAVFSDLDSACTLHYTPPPLLAPPTPAPYPPLPLLLPPQLLIQGLQSEDVSRAAAVMLQ